MTDVYYGRNYLIHYGTPRHSGRYPWGSGKNPYQGDDKASIEADTSGKSEKSFDWKKAALIGGGIVATGLAAYGGYTVYKNYHAIPDIDSITKLPLIKKPHSIKDDVKCLNPGLISNGISYVDAIEGSHANCALNTTAYDLRRRGYDVYPGLSTEGYTWNEITSWFKGNRDWDAPNIHSVAGLEDYILNKYPEGSRGNLGLIYGPLGGGGGHSVIWEIQNGKLEIRDGQAHITKQSLKKALQLADVSSTRVLRTDDLIPDIDALSKNGLIRTDNNTKFVVDHLAEMGLHLLMNPIVQTEILGVAYGGYKLNEKIKESKAKEKTNEPRKDN